jgi:hypothetical protein
MPDWPPSDPNPPAAIAAGVVSVVALIALFCSYVHRISYLRRSPLVSFLCIAVGVVHLVAAAALPIGRNSKSDAPLLMAAYCSTILLSSISPVSIP